MAHFKKRIGQPQGDEQSDLMNLLNTYPSPNSPIQQKLSAPVIMSTSLQGTMANTFWIIPLLQQSPPFQPARINFTS